MPRNRNLQRYHIQVNARVSVNTLAQLAMHMDKHGVRIRSIAELLRESLEDFVTKLNQHTKKRPIENIEESLQILDELGILPNSNDFDRSIARAKFIEKTREYVGITTEETEYAPKLRTKTGK